MRQATQPIAIVPSGNSSSTNRRPRRTSTTDSNLSDDSFSSGNEQDYYNNPPVWNRPLGQPFTTHRSPNYEVDAKNVEDLLLVGSLPSSRRERRYLVSTGGQEVGGYGHYSNATGPNARIVLAPRGWDHHPTRQRVNSSPPPAPMLESRKDQGRAETISRYANLLFYWFLTDDGLLLSLEFSFFCK